MSHYVRFTAVMLVLVLGAMLAACGVKEDNPPPPSQPADNTSQEASSSEAPAAEQPAEEQIYPVTVKHAKGETVIRERPERIAVIFEWYNADNLLSLGVEPVAITHDPAWYSNDLGVASYLVDRLEGVETLGDRASADLEKLAMTQPDLILTIHVPFLEQQYNQFEKIAPTIMLDNYAGDWEDYHRQIAAIFGEEAAAEQTFKEIADKTAEVKAQVAQHFGDDTLAIVQMLPKTLRIFGKGDPVTALIYDELGITPAALAMETEGITEISLEGLAELDPDRILIYWTTPDRLEPVEATSVWQNLKAVRNGHVYFPPSTVEWNPSGPIGRSVLLDRIAETFNP